MLKHLIVVLSGVEELKYRARLACVIALPPGITVRNQLEVSVVSSVSS